MSKSMLPRKPGPVTPESVSVAQQVAASERAQVLADILAADDPNPSMRDREEYQNWAERAVVGCAKLGPLAMREAQARKAAAAVIRGRHHVDVERAAAECGARWMPDDHFEAGLRAYFAVLQGVFHAPQGLKITVRAPFGAVIQDYLYCPTCAPAQRETEAKLGNAVPSAHMVSAETRQKDGAIVELADIDWDADSLRCCRCQVEEVDPW